MLKKVFLFTVTAIISFLSFSFWQNIGNIKTSFCHEWKDMNIVTQADKETEICLIFENRSDFDLTLDVSFVDGAITPNGNRACFDPSKGNLNFGQYVLPWDFDLELPANSQKKQIYKIKFPVWYSGISHGCVLYSIKDKDSSVWAMKVVFSKSHSIDILVWWVEVKSKIKAKSISISWDQIYNQIVLDLENKWNTDQSINIRWNISNNFGYSEDFEMSGLLLKAGETEWFSSNNLHLPDYKWFFSVKVDMDYQPQFNFHITNQGQKAEYSLPWTISFSKILILWNRFYVISGGTILVLLIIVGKKIFNKQKNK